MFGNTCEVKGCDKPAKYIGSFPESGIIDMCGDCYRDLYRS